MESGPSSQYDCPGMEKRPKPETYCMKCGKPGYNIAASSLPCGQMIKRCRGGVLSAIGMPNLLGNGTGRREALALNVTVPVGYSFEGYDALIPVRHPNSTKLLWSNDPENAPPLVET